jgi:hypothetical protein
MDAGMTVFHDPDDVGGAWADVMANMPEGWYFRSLRNLTVAEGRQMDAVKRHGPHWRAQALRRHDLGMTPSGMLAIGQTAALALWRLADYLTKVGHGTKWAPTFGDPRSEPQTAEALEEALG